jgi:aminoglycoside phosphotransferase (APT) family kinase protein
LAELPVPRLLLAEEGRGELPYPCLVFEWIEGATLNALRRQAAPDDVLAVAAPLGMLLARLSGTRAPPALLQTPSAVPTSSLEPLLALTEQRLQHGRPRQRLSRVLADALWTRLWKQAGALSALGSTECLVHGDFGGRNILITAGHNSTIAGVID